MITVGGLLYDGMRIAKRLGETGATGLQNRTWTWWRLIWRGRLRFRRCRRVWQGCMWRLRLILALFCLQALLHLCNFFPHSLDFHVFGTPQAFFVFFFAGRRGPEARV